MRKPKKTKKSERARTKFRLETQIPPRLIRRFGFRTNSEDFNLSQEECRKFCDYLENPTKTGIWKLRAKWDKFGGVSKRVIEMLNNKLNKKNGVEITRNNRSSRLVLDNDNKRELVRSTGRLTFIFSLFAHLVHLEKRDETFAWFTELEQPEDRLIFDIINLPAIKKEFNDAYEFFKENIYYKEFNPKMTSNKLKRIKCGLFLLAEDEQKASRDYYRLNEDRAYSQPEDEETKEITLIALAPEPLEKIKTFYEKINKVSGQDLVSVHSPEEEVFDQYFSFLACAYDQLIDSENTKRKFRTAIKEYQDNDYSHAISTIGLVAEDFLTQIYETLLRDPVPKGLTLGDLYSLLQNSIRDKFKQPKTDKTKNIEQIYKKINTVIENKKLTGANKEALQILRDLLSFIKDDRIQILTTISSLHKYINKPIDGLSVFPRILRENIIELINNRNAVSHKSKITIGNYQALRSVYCCITLILWWTREKKSIAWKEPPEDILTKCVERNSMVSVLTKKPEDSQ